MTCQNCNQQYNFYRTWKLEPFVDVWVCSKFCYDVMLEQWNSETEVLKRQALEQQDNIRQAAIQAENEMIQNYKEFGF